MAAREAERKLRDMLNAAGLREDESPPPDAAIRMWNVFKDFAALPVVGVSELADSDGILFQTGVYDWGEGDAFNFSCIRQFAFDDADGEYDHMEQLEALLLYAPDDELRGLPVAEIWSFGVGLDEYFREVEATNAFAAITGRPRDAIGVAVRLEEV